MIIRPPQSDADDQRIVDLVNLIESEPTTVERMREWSRKLPPGRSFRQRLAEDTQGRVTGYSEVIHEIRYPDKHFALWLVVDTPYRHQGIGQALYADALEYLREQGAATLESETRENCPEGLAFATQRGFEIDRHRFESVLDLTHFDPRPFEQVIPAVEASGIRFSSVAAFGDTLDARHKLYDLNFTTGLDVPGNTGDWWPFEEFNATISTAEWYNPKGQLIALDGEAWIGMAAVRLYKHAPGAYNLMTGVLREYRGRHIAMALKLLAIQYALANGAKYMRTHNDSKNGPMLAINRRLGYQPCPGKFLLRGSVQ